MMMMGVRLHTRDVCSASIWVAAFGCSFTFIRTQNHLFSAPTKTLESWVWDCNQVADWIPDEHAERSLFRLIRSGWPTSSLITNMRLKEKILRSSNFLLARDPDFPPFVWSNLTKPALPESAGCADLFLKILPDEEIRCFACGLGTDVGQHLFVCHLVFMQRKPGQTETARPPPRQQLMDGGLVVDLCLLTITADFLWISPTRQNDRIPAITWWPDL